MLPYTAEVLFSLYGRYLREWWLPGALVLVLTVAVLYLAAGRRPRGRRAAAGLLAVGWLWVGVVFHHGYFADIHFAAPVYVGLFVAQGLALLWAGPLRGRLALRFRSDAAGWVGSALIVSALIGYPLADHLSGYPADSPRLVGLAAGPTALFTLGALMHVADRTPGHLLVVPVLWALIAGFSGWVLDIPADLAAPFLAIAALVALGCRSRRPGAGLG